MLVVFLQLTQYILYIKAYNDTAVFQEIVYNVTNHLFFYGNKNLLILLRYVTTENGL